MTVAEFWTVSCGFGVEDKKTLGGKLRETLDENKELQQKVNRLEHSLTYTALKNMEANIEDLQTRLNNSRASNEAYRSMNSVLSRRHASTMHQTQELKMQIDAMTEENTSLHNVIDSFVDKCKDLEAKVEGYEKKLELLNTVVTPDLDAQLKSMTERLDKSIADRKELQADRDIWFNKNCEKLAEIEELKKKIQSLEDDIKSKTRSRDAWRTEAERKARSRDAWYAEVERLRKEITESYADGYSDGNEEGQNELWEMLQMVKDMQPNEFDPECECLGDVIDMDLEDFKEAYGKWEEEQKKAAEEAKKQHVEFMRGYLKKYCIGKLCFGCPLYDTSKPVSSCLFSKLTDEEVEKCYRKVVDSEWEKAPGYFRSTIEAVFTAEAKINKDLLKDICGIKPKEEEHKFEYGDAVRIHWWRDYDYMYIAPDEKEETLVHLFDPENHAIVTTHISNVRYNGGRILVAEEDDIRKIWKYMK